MSEPATTATTATLTLTLLERVAVHRMLAAYRPADRNDERALVRVWGALDLDGIKAGGKVVGNQVEYAVGDLERSGEYEIDKAGVNWLNRLPVAPSGELARLLAPLREQVEKAREKLK